MQDFRTPEGKAFSKKPIKKIIIVRGGQVKPKDVLKDTFDSTIGVFSEDEKSLYQVPFANTDFYKGYKGGIVAEGYYTGICANRKDNNKKVIFIFNKIYEGAVNKIEDLTQLMRVLTSLIPNPNHKNKKLISDVLIHCDSYSGGWSEGCITVYPDYWNKFIGIFKLNEMVDIELKRNPDWKAPDYYQETKQL